jgi:vacuolar-type H+-ATPase subunit E/Vma4
MNQHEKLRHFTSAIESDARGESERILENIRLEMESALAAAEDDILNESFRYIKNEVARARTDSWRRISHRMMENKNALNRRREEMSEIVMGRVTERLSEYVKTEDYVQGLIKSARAILYEFNHCDTVIYLRANDAPLEKQLRLALKNEHFTVETGEFELGGLMGTCPATHMQIDESFDTKFEELRGHFAELFGLQLSL